MASSCSLDSAFGSGFLGPRQAQKPSSEPPSRTHLCAVETPPDSLSEDELAALVGRLEQMKNRQTLDLAYRIGRTITEELYEGDPAAHRRRGKHDADYTRLVNHPQLTLSPSTVWRALGVFELCCRMPHLLDCPGLKARHVYAVLSLSAEDQERLLEQATRQRWPVEKLESEASLYRGIAGRGRPRHTPLRRAAVLLGRFLELEVVTDEACFDDAERVGSALELIRRARMRCEKLERMLSERQAGCVSGGARVH